MQFLGVIKCLNNPFFTICRIAHTKNPHRANFGASDLFVTTTNPKPFARFNNPTQIMCTLTDALGLDQLKGKIPLDNSTYEIIS